VRSCITIARAPAERVSPERLADRLWGDDRDTKLLTRAAVNPGDTTLPMATTTWNFLQSLAPLSAGAGLFGATTTFPFGRAATLSVPSFTANVASVAYIGQGTGVVPMVQYTSARVQLALKKLAVATALSEEMLEASEAAEMLVRDVLLRSTALGLDNVLFDSNPATTVRPAGLRYNVAALTATATGSPLQDVMAQDLVKLAEAVKPVGGRIAFVVDPARAINMSLRLLAGARETFAVFASNALAATDIICVALDGLVGGIGDGPPEISTSKSALVHMEDTAPQPIIGGTPAAPVLAVPTRSLWQTRSVGITLRFTLDWGTRHPAATAWMTAVNW
jgi:hypothetical protein